MALGSKEHITTIQWTTAVSQLAHSSSYSQCAVLVLLCAARSLCFSSIISVDPLEDALKLLRQRNASAQSSSRRRRRREVLKQLYSSGMLSESRAGSSEVAHHTRSHKDKALPLVRMYARDLAPSIPLSPCSTCAYVCSLRAPLWVLTSCVNNYYVNWVARWCPAASRVRRAPQLHAVHTCMLGRHVCTYVCARYACCTYMCTRYACCSYVHARYMHCSTYVVLVVQTKRRLFCIGDILHSGMATKYISDAQCQQMAKVFNREGFYSPWKTSSYFWQSLLALLLVICFLLITFFKYIVSASKQMYDQCYFNITTCYYYISLLSISSKIKCIHHHQIDHCTFKF